MSSQSNHRQVTALLTMLICMMLFVSIPPAKAQFVIAGWEYPDEYWQGIKGFNLYENSTGSWLLANGTIEPDDPTIFDWTAGVSIKIRVWADLNSTLVGAGSTAEGQNYLRHNVTVTCLSVPVFNQNNFTYYGVSTEAEIYTYSYDVVLNFIPADGQIYTVIVTYEVFY